MIESWKLTELRARITQIDTQLMTLIAKRLDITRDIQKLKYILQLPVEDRDRERDVLMRMRLLAADLRFPVAFVEPVWKQLFAAAKLVLTDVKEQPGKPSENPPGCRKGGEGE